MNMKNWLKKKEWKDPQSLGSSAGDREGLMCHNLMFKYQIRCNRMIQASQKASTHIHSGAECGGVPDFVRAPSVKA